MVCGTTNSACEGLRALLVTGATRVTVGRLTVSRLMVACVLTIISSDIDWLQAKAAGDRAVGVLADTPLMQPETWQD